MRRIVATLAVSALALLGISSAAQANTAPNSFNYVGESWVDVPDENRAYAENFGSTSGRDDYSFRYVAADITCTKNGVTAVGPFWTTEDLGSSDCVDGSTNPVDPIDDATGLGSLPLGFDINFFGDLEDSAWPNTNGGVFFDEPSSAYNKSVASLVGNAESSAIFPLAADLYWDHTESNFWTGHTTIGGSDAVVFAWEKFHNCCSDTDGSANISFQLVLIDQGSGDFDAWFNYDAVDGFDQGYDAAEFTVDMNTGVTAGSNIVEGFPDIDNVPTECTEFSMDGDYGDFTDEEFYDAYEDDDIFVKAVSESNKTVSLWSDDTCETAANINVLQDVATSGNAYMTLENSDDSSYDSIGMGWGTYDQANGKISSTELLHNVDASTLSGNGASSLINRSWNTTVAGRMGLGQRDGGTIGDPAVDGGGGGGGGGNTTTELADTGFDTTSALGFALAAVAVGAVAMRRTRRQR
jgi:hypothetical protein